ncbi:hypothetical protein [Bacillus rubiinfantis]|uniref:hypothetical protein n=1 Tax=Bacillus rubiinfantis TaxID=1499680 RepID=UPI0005AB10C7|nr:hypothetical protein [Bacillus rubiinfantis]
MIIASDLDRTLMYSARAMKELTGIGDYELEAVETKDNEPVGFMTKTAFEQLESICQQALFIPVTTRTTEQFNRFTIFSKEIQLPYAITTNGAYILYHGKPLGEWSCVISEAMKRGTASLPEMMSLLAKEGYHFLGHLRQVEHFFFYYTFTSLPAEFDIIAVEKLASQYGWRISLQGRKLYFIPKVISKGAALEFICQREGMEPIAGAGDSLLDWDFLQHCRHRFVPKHGELARWSKDYCFSIIDQDGVKAGEEILVRFRDSLLLERNLFKDKHVQAGK